MLIILTSHPIQYQAPLWRRLAAEAPFPVQVWFLTRHGVEARLDAEFQQTFQWDVDLLDGYDHRFLTVNEDWDLKRFRGVRLQESLAERLTACGAKAMWIEGWRLKAFWSAAHYARRAGVRTWMRGESNDLKRDAPLRAVWKRPVLGRHLRRFDRFLCIGGANRRLYQSYGISSERCVTAPYCVDNDFFTAQAEREVGARDALRAQWGVPRDAFCVLFCGKLIAKKRPLDLARALNVIQANGGTGRPLHLLCVGSGELRNEMESACRVCYDEGRGLVSDGNGTGVGASFTGFLNQSQIAAAYVTADLLVLPSDCGETWGLVANEALACGVPAAVSDECGCAEDLVRPFMPELVFRCGDVADLARAIRHAMEQPVDGACVRRAADSHHLRHTVEAAVAAYSMS